MKYLSIRILPGFFVACALSVSTRAQTPFDRLRAVPTPSPEAASLAKQVEFPVSYFNGMADISIPIYEAKSGDISVPITLSYNTSGIRVGEEASWVGLGWALKAGGMISKQVKGTDDNYSSNKQFNKYFPNQDGHFYKSPDNVPPGSMNMVKSGCCSMYDVAGTSIIYDVANPDLTYSSNTKAEGEPDVYIYNFGSYSGKFMWDGTRYLDLGGEKHQVKYLGPDKIVMVSPDGFTYNFGQVEKSETGNIINPSSYYLTTITSATGKNVVLTYNTYAIPAAQMPTVSEEYVVKDGTGGGSGYLNRSVVQTTINNLCYLDKIIFDNGSVQFATGNRSDLNGLALTCIGINDKNGNRLKNYTFSYGYFASSTYGMSSANDFLNTVPSGLSGSDISVALKALSDSYPASFRGSRLRLDRIIENAPPLSGQVYSFDYYDGDSYSLPYKSSRAQDYWGYFNGQLTNYTLVPDYNPIANTFISIYPNSGPSVIFNGFYGANRNPDAESMKAGMLKKVTYPTQGWAQYEYEPNTYTNAGPGQLMVSATQFAQDNGTTTIPGGSVTYVTLTGANNDVTIDITINCDYFGQYPCDPNNPAAYATSNVNTPGMDSYQWDCGCLGSGHCSSTGADYTLYGMVERLDPASGEYVSTYAGNLGTTLPLPKISIDNLPCNQKGSFHAAYRLPGGVYRLTANYPDNKPVDPQSTISKKMAQTSMTYTYVSPYGTTETVGGGLRIARISKFDPVTNTTLAKTYKYKGGILMNAPRFYWHIINADATIDQGMGNPWPIGLANSYDYLYGNPAIEYSASANGGLIGYGQVTEQDQASGGGYTVYEYYWTRADNFADIGFDSYPILAYAPGIPSTPVLTNGFLSRKGFYTPSNQILKNISYTPAVINAYTYWSFRAYNKLQIEDNSSGGGCSSSYCGNGLFYFYPVQMGKVVPISSVEMDFSYPDAVTTNVGTTVQKTTQYSYNSDGYLSSETITDSRTLPVTTQMKYPRDYSATAVAALPWISSLTNLNMINMPLEQLQSVNGSVTGGSFVTYETNGPLMTPSQVYKIETALPKTIATTTTTGILPPEFILQGTVKYNTDGNLSYATAANDITTVYLWGYNKSLPIAKAQNTTAADVYFNGFEESTASDDPTAHTGKKVFTGSTYTIPASDYNSTAPNLKMSYWYWSSNKWNFSGELPFNATINGVSKLDDIRVYPAGVPMTTYTYDPPLKGMTSSTDENNIVTYYDYDSLGRLSNIRDYQNNIVKHYSYHYAGH